MKSILITGCNRGLGLGFVKYLVNSKNCDHLIATCRNPEQAKELLDIQNQHKKVKVLKFDIINENSYKNFIASIQNIVGENGLNLLINNAGVSPKSTRVNFVKLNQMTETILTNSIAPLMFTKSLLPLLKQAAEINKNTPAGINKSAVINISSILGSISENTSGGLYPYRASKAALNAITKSLSIDLKDTGILVLSLHPGWVKTDMGGPNAPMSIDESVQNIITTLQKIDESHNGKFIQYDGKELDW